jgi:hypothetical protein
MTTPENAMRLDKLFFAPLTRKDFGFDRLRGFMGKRTFPTAKFVAIWLLSLE